MKSSLNKRICLLGNGWGALAALDGLHKQFDDVIVTSTDKDVIDRARTYGYQASEKIIEHHIDLYLCAGFNEILSEVFITANQVINIHYSLLPKFRGRHATVWTILNNEPYFGLSVHIMNQFIDDGPLIYQHKFKNTGQNSKEVIEACNEHIVKNISQVVADFLNNKIKAKNQIRSNATWVCKRNLDDCLIDFEQSVEYLSLFFRALVEPYPLPRIITKKGLVEVVEAELVDSVYHMINGRVVNIEHQRVWIKISNGFLIISKIRDAHTKQELDVQNVFKIGMRLL